MYSIPNPDSPLRELFDMETLVGMLKDPQALPTLEQAAKSAYKYLYEEARAVTITYIARNAMTNRVLLVQFERTVRAYEYEAEDNGKTYFLSGVQQNRLWDFGLCQSVPA